MSNIFLIGKDLPDCVTFAEGLAGNENTVFTTAKSNDETNKFESSNIFATTWNKSSAISAHSLLIQAENKLTNINNIIFYFDTAYYCSKYELDKTEEIAPAVDTMINSYLYATSEILKRIDQKKEPITVTFLLKEYPSKNEITLNPKIQTSFGASTASTIVSIAQSAFKTLASNFAINVNDRDYLSVILAKNSFSNELYKNDKAVAQWCIESLNILRAQKNKQSVKNAATWNKVGAKLQTGFALFR